MILALSWTYVIFIQPFILNQQILAVNIIWPQIHDCLLEYGFDGALIIVDTYHELPFSVVSRER